MKKEVKEKLKKKTIIVEVEVNDEIEAYQVVSSLAFEHSVLNVRYGKYREDFDKKNTPFHFLKNNKNNKKSFRDVMGERLK